MTIPLQDASIDVWDSKYRLKGKDGKIIDQTVEDTKDRVANALAAVEKDVDGNKSWAKLFRWAMDNGAMPAGRIMSNAGASEYKSDTSLINCTVSGTIGDSMEGILKKVVEAGLTLKAGCGIGYDFSTLRPNGAWVRGAGASTSGPLSFMDIYDSMCFTISSAGGRRGAQMGVLDVSHPDVLDFISAKRDNGRLRQFNMSLLVTKDFVNSVKKDGDWGLKFPADNNEIYKRIPARVIWDSIMKSTYDFAEPGFILIDEINDMNNNWFCENIRATNPCGEQPLPPYGACLLGSINLTCFVEGLLEGKPWFSWKKFRAVVGLFTRMLDNVVEINGLPLAEQRRELKRKRRHGMGFLGLGSTLALMGIRYGSEESLEFTERVSMTLALVGWEFGVELAKEKGPAPIMEEEFIVDGALVERRPEILDHYSLGDRVKGKVLLGKYSNYMKRLRSASPGLVDDIIKYGSRFTHHTSIAPTGTIALSFGNNASNGIEPSFAHSYNRNIIRPGKKTKESVKVHSYEKAMYEFIHGGDSHLPDHFVTASDVTPKEHVDVQAAAQKWVDSSISKTINIPSDFSYEDFKGIYLYAIDRGLKGCTTFRYNPSAFQGVLVKSEDAEKTVYVFKTESGDVITARGTDEIEYDGEVHTAANLYDAIKENYYGRF